MKLLSMQTRSPGEPSPSSSKHGRANEGACLQPSAWVALAAAASDFPMRDDLQWSMTAGGHETTGEDLVGLCRRKREGDVPSLRRMA